MMLSLGGLFLVASMAAGQAEPPPTLLEEYGNLMVGRWVGDVTLIADWPGQGKKGDKVIGHLSVRWIADKRGLEDEWFGGQGTGRTVYFWDPASRKIRQCGVDSGGTTSDYQIWKQGDRWLFRGGGCLADGTKYEGEGTLIVRDGGNTLVAEGTFLVGGKKALDLHDVYKRASK